MLYPYQRISLTLSATVLVLGCTGYAATSWAQVATPSVGNQAQTVSKKVVYLPLRGTDTGQPTRQGSAATSGGSCASASQAGDKRLFALIPKLDTQGITVDANPTLWFYVPYAAGNFDSMLFTLRDKAGKAIYETKLVAASGLPGVISLRLPTTNGSLAMNQKYDWQLTVYCQAGRTGGRYVSGSVTRIPVSLALKGELGTAATPLDKAAVYARNGIWFEAITTIGNNRARSSNAGLNNAWADLLKGVGLGEIDSKPVVDCCKPSTK